MTRGNGVQIVNMSAPAITKERATDSLGVVPVPRDFTDRIASMNVLLGSLESVVRKHVIA